MAPSSSADVEAYGSFTSARERAQAGEPRKAARAPARRAGVTLGGMAVGIALGVVLGGGVDLGGAASKAMGLAARARAATGAARAEAVAAVDANVGKEVRETEADVQAAYEARETVAIAAATAAGYQRAPGGVRPSLRPRQKGDNLRWTDEEVAEWKCCAKIINGAPIDSPPFTQPTALYSSDGVLKTELEVTQARYEGPLSFNTRGYNNGVPGPTLYVKRGDWLKIDLKNGLNFPTSALPVAHDHAEQVKIAVRDATGECLPYGEPNVTSLHVHGLHTNVDGYGDYPLKMAHPHETAPYYLYIREDHPTGTFWYHPHSKDGAALQEAGMMAGVVIVEDDPEAWTDDLSDITDRVMMFQWVDSMHDFDNFTFMSKCSGSDMNLQYNVHSEAASDNYVTLNSQYLPEIDISTGEYQRWRLVNAISHAFLNITISGERGDGTSPCQMWEIAADGVYYHKPRQTNEVFVTLGGRKDVIVRCGEAGTYTMVSSQFNGLFSDPNEYMGEIAKVRVYAGDQGAEIDMDHAKLPSAGLYDRSFADSPVDNTYDLTISNWADTPTEWFTVNGIVYDGLIHNRIQLNSLQEWTITQDYDNRYAEFTNHNWHLHTHHFQIAGSSDPRGGTEDWSLWDWRDTVNVPHGGWVKIRFLAENYAGYLLHHCHVFNHETAGMKQLAQVINCTDKDIYDGLRSYASSDDDDTFCTYASDDDASADDDATNRKKRGHDSTDGGGGGSSTAHDGTSVDDGV